MVNRSGKLPWNGHFMFLQHFEEQQVDICIWRGTEVKWKKVKQRAMLVTEIGRHISFCGKLLWNGYFMFLQHFEEQQVDICI